MSSLPRSYAVFFLSEAFTVIGFEVLLAMIKAYSKALSGVCLLSPIHTARWSRKIAGVPSVWTQTRPGINSGIDPGLGPSNIAGFSPGTSAVRTKAGSMP